MRLTRVVRKTVNPLSIRLVYREKKREGSVLSGFKRPVRAPPREGSLNWDPMGGRPSVTLKTCRPVVPPTQPSHQRSSSSSEGVLGRLGPGSLFAESDDQGNTHTRTRVEGIDEGLQHILTL